MSFKRGNRAANGGILTHAKDIQIGDDIEVICRVRIINKEQLAALMLADSDNTPIYQMGVNVIGGALAGAKATLHVASSALVSVVKTKDKPSTWTKLRSWTRKSLGYKNSVK